MINRLTCSCLAAMIAFAVLPSCSQETGLGQPARLDPPDVVLIDQEGISHHLVRDLFRGKIAVVSFVFTGCSTTCSLVGANMGALDRLLGVLRLVRRLAYSPSLSTRPMTRRNG